MRLLHPVDVMRQVTSRPVKGKAIQFLYQEEDGATFRLVSLIEVSLDVKVSRSYDPQSGTGYHVRLDDLHSRMLGHGDWVVVDSFGKVSVVPDSEFKTYYEPEFAK